jgi:SAM-dependent methyltransferase
MLAQLKAIVPPGLRHRLKLLLHRGGAYLCPFCGYSARDLAPVGLDLPALAEHAVVGAGAREAACLKCGSTDRERLVYLYLRDVARLFDTHADTAILHIAPEPRLSKAIRRLGPRRYVCGDLFADGYDYPADVVPLDVLDLPFGDGAFDWVLCNHVLEHVLDDRRAMGELLRVLRPGGRAILQVPVSKTLPETLEDTAIVDPQERAAVFGQPDHVRIYGQDYGRRLEECGFRVHRIDGREELRHFGVNPEETLFVGERPTAGAEGDDP